MNISHSSATHSPFARNRAALTAPILCKLEVRPVEAVFGWTQAQSAAWDVTRDTGNLAAAEASYAYACAQLGVANRSKVMRRQRVAAAFRYINQRRAVMCAARKALAASIAAQAAPFAIGRQHALPLA